MASQDNWLNEACDERGRWTAGDAAKVNTASDWPQRNGIYAALAGQIAARDRLESIVSRFNPSFRAQIAEASLSRKTDGVSVLADTLNQLARNPN